MGQNRDCRKTNEYNTFSTESEGLDAVGDVIKREGFLMFTEGFSPRINTDWIDSSSGVRLREEQTQSAKVTIPEQRSRFCL